MGKFNFNESPVAKVAEEIRDGNKQPTVQMQQTEPQQQQGRVEQPTPQPTPQPQQPAPVTVPDASPSVNKPLKTKKTENGIVINVPMQDYMQLTMMKMQTGRTLKDLALQAIHEFIENHQEELR